MTLFILGLVFFVAAGALMRNLPWWTVMIIAILISIGTNLLNSSGIF